MSRRLTVAEAKQRCPSMLARQSWKGQNHRYRFRCKRHGIYRKWWCKYKKGCPQCGHIQGGLNRRTFHEFKCVVCKILFSRPKSYCLKVKHPQFCSRACQRTIGHTRADGYRSISVNGKQVPEHRHLMEKKLGRPLRKNETVHHRNGRRADNRLRNLELKVGAHGKHQSIKDLVRDAEEILRLYKRAA